jgi:hypothetical protein
VRGVRGWEGEMDGGARGDWREMRGSGTRDEAYSNSNHSGQPLID